MPPKKFKVGTSEARKKKKLRAAESTEERQTRQESNRVRNARARFCETVEERALRQEEDRARHAQARLCETAAESALRQEEDSARHSRARLCETVEERAIRHEEDSARHSRARLCETVEERALRQEEDILCHARARSCETNLNLSAFHYDANCNYNLHQSVIIGKMDKICRFCGALKFRNETPGMCCAGGKVKLSELNLPPEPLLTLLSGSTTQSKHFLKNIRKYNSCFQMTSFGATNIVQDNYMPTFKVQGQIYHRAGSLLPLPEEDYKFLQIYFMGNNEEQINQRCRLIKDTERDIVAGLQNLFDEHNELIRMFRSALEQMPADDYTVVIRADKTPVGQHERQFNAPTINEVAIVIVGEEFNSRDIILYRRNGALQRVSETHRSYDALQYPIIFWQGEDGYH